VLKTKQNKFKIMEEIEMKEVMLDCFGEACPVPLVKAQNKLKELEIGDVLIVQIDHSCAMKNVPEWARKEGYNVEVEEVDDGEWEVIIEKNK
jgi:TusA-related sulfurtransferase